MTRNKAPKMILAAAMTAALLWTMPSCGDKKPSYNDRETFARETYAAAEGADVSFADGLTRNAFPADTPAGEWLAGCEAPDRDDQFDAYTLRHEAETDGHTTFTYLIYYPHGGASVTASPELLEGESGYVINLAYAEGGDGAEGYSLCRLSVTLPTDHPPRLRLLTGQDTLGVMSTVTEIPIPSGA